MSANNDEPKKPILGNKHEDSRKTNKVWSSLEFRLMLLSVPPASMNMTLVFIMALTLKQKSTSTSTVPQVVKYRKLKPTNPKPFKLRTDVRDSILVGLFV